MKVVHMVIDMQFGSTGKGLLAGWLAGVNKYDTIATAWAPNAGHTFIKEPGSHRFIHTMLANGVVSEHVKTLLIGPGSLINPQSLEDEIEAVRALGYMKDTKILIHPHAAVVLQRHRDEEEATMTGIGSTKKGVGAAMADRISRRTESPNVASQGLSPYLDGYIVSIEEYNAAVDASETMLIEGAQGFSLSMYHGFYPYCTSRDVTPAQILADVAVPIPRAGCLRVFGTMRCHPIRVANRYDDKGNQIGWSGPCYIDQEELQWSDLGMLPELTTVTKLPRRIFSFSDEQTKAAMRACMPDMVFLNFTNYVKSDEEMHDILTTIDRHSRKYLGRPARFIIGTGPTAKDVTYVIDIKDAFAVWQKHRDYSNI